MGALGLGWLDRIGYRIKRHIPVLGLWRILQVSYRPMRLLGRKYISPEFSLSAIKNLFFGT